MFLAVRFTRCLATVGSQTPLTEHCTSGFAFAILKNQEGRRHWRRRSLAQSWSVSLLDSPWGGRERGSMMEEIWGPPAQQRVVLCSYLGPYRSLWRPPVIGWHLPSGGRQASCLQIRLWGELYRAAPDLELQTLICFSQRFSASIYSSEVAISRCSLVACVRQCVQTRLLRARVLTTFDSHSMFLQSC